MAHEILAAVVVLTVACQALYHGPATITVPGFFYGDAHEQINNCPNVLGGIPLNLSNVGLRRLDSYFTSSPNVSFLSFDNNEIGQVSPSTFRLMPNLLYLSLARNNLSFANLSRLEGHPNLCILVLDENREANLTEGPILQFEGEFPRLQHLHARDCGLRDVASLAFAPRLLHLHLASNDLAASNLKFLDEAAELRVLDLANNRLRRFDAGKLGELIELRLDDNKFDRLCAAPEDCDTGSVLALAGLKWLRFLFLARNAIAKIERSAFRGASKLTHLDLSDNQIQSIEDTVFDGLNDLRGLSLKGNQLSEIPDIRKLKSLQNLSLANNYLETVRNGSLFENVYVKHLDLSNNKIAKVELDAFRRQHYLEILDLSNNKLSDFPKSWLMNMYNLKVLKVNNNLLLTLDNLHLGNLVHNKQFKEVYLQNNQITKFYSHSFNHQVLSRTPGLAFVFFDAANPTEQSKNAEECKCDCKSNDIDSWDLD